MIRFFTVFSFLLAQAFSVSAQTVPQFITDSLDNYIESALEKWKVPGVAIAIVKDGKIILTKGYGFRDIEKKTKVDENTLFQIGSTSKAFTSATIALLENRGICTLEDPVKKWFKEFNLLDDYREENATLLDLLGHRLGYYFWTGEFFMFDSDLSENEILERFSQLPATEPFRYDFNYCNIGYYFAGRCLEAMTRKDFSQVMKDEIFTPLQMNNTTATPSDISKSKNACRGHHLLYNQATAVPYASFDWISPAGGICSNATDMSKWLLELLNAFKDSAAVLNSDIMYRVTTPLTTRGMSDGSFHKNHFLMYGLGWNVEDYESVANFWHAGGIHGFSTQLSIIPELDLGVMVLTNSDNGLFPSGIKLDIMNAFLGLPFENIDADFYKMNEENNEAIKAYLSAKQDTIRAYFSSENNMSQYVGVYSDSIYGNAEIIYHQKKLTLQFEHHPDLSGSLELVTDNRMFCTFNSPTYGVAFIRIDKEENLPLSFSITFEESVDSYTYHFIKQ